MNGIATMLAALTSHAACLGSSSVVLKTRNKSQDSPASVRTYRGFHATLNRLLTQKLKYSHYWSCHSKHLCISKMFQCKSMGSKNTLNPIGFHCMDIFIKPTVNHFNSERPNRFLVATRDANANASVPFPLDSARQQIERHITDHGLLQRIIIQAE